MENKNLNKTPWLNKDGKVKQDSRIKKLGKKWPKETWEKYLDLSVGTLDDKNLIFSPCMDTELVNEGLDMLRFFQHRKYDASLRFSLELALDELSKAEKSVLEKYFLEEKSHSEIAIQLKITPTTVRVLKRKAVQKLKKILISDRFLRHLHLQKKKSQK